MNKAQWFRNYQRYLKTPEWKDKRERVWRRDGYICTACGNAPATQVHHMAGSYKYGRYVPLFLLQSVCTQCHETITAIDRGELKPWNWDEVDAFFEL